MIVYGLFDPIEPGVVRYVGSTQDIARRLADHNRQPANDDARGRWVATVLAAGRRVDAQILAYASSEAEADSLEAYYVAMFRSFGWPITNSTTGGRSGFGWSQESRLKMSAAHKGNVQRKGSQHRPESIDKMRAAHSGKQHSAETKVKMRSAHLGRKYKPMTTAARQRISDSHIGKPWSEERKATYKQSKRSRGAD